MPKRAIFPYKQRGIGFKAPPPQKRVDRLVAMHIVHPNAETAATSACT